MNKFVLVNENNKILGYAKGKHNFGFLNPHNILYFENEREALSFRIKENFINTRVLSEESPIVPTHDYPSKEIIKYLSDLRL